jgi:hypothetical protein
MSAFWLAAGSGCLFEGRGGGTETESQVAGRAVNDNGGPAAFARVTLRPADYLSDLVSSEHVQAGVRDTVTDGQGRYGFKDLPAGAYRVEIGGTESGGAINDFFLPESGKGKTLAPDTLRPRGSIAGSIASDSDSQDANFVQVFGMERLVQTDPQGNFILYSMPQGVYDLRVSSHQAFRREAVRRNVAVQAGQRTTLEPVVLAKEAKLSFRIDSGAVRITGLDSTNPVIFDNERWDNGPDDEYIWAKASAGSLDLRGNIVTRDFHTGTGMDGQLRRARQELWEARMAGFANLPEITLGATAKLAWPDSGFLEDIPSMPSAGSELIVAEARKATPEKPLLVVVGGPLTTVANAYLTDPSIAPRMIVAGTFTYGMQPEDTVANYLVARKCRFLQWARDYVWAGKTDTSLIRGIPPTLMGERVRAFLFANAKSLPFGDIAPVVYLFHPQVWKSADIVKVNRAMEVRPASDITFDFVDIPFLANDWSGYGPEFFGALANPRAYHALSLPGRMEAEAYTAASKAIFQPADSSTGNEFGMYADGGYTEHRIASAGGSFQAKIRYRSTGGAKLDIAVDRGPSAASITLPATPDWTEADGTLALDPGEHVLRVTVSGGTAALDRIDFSHP